MPLGNCRIEHIDRLIVTYALATGQTSAVNAYFSNLLLFNWVLCMGRTKKLLYLLILVVLFVLNMASLVKMSEWEKRYCASLTRIYSTSEIKLLLENIVAETQSVINGYDVAKARKIEFSDGKQYVYLNQIFKRLYDTGKTLEDDETKARFELIVRTVNSFAKNMDALKAKFVLRDFDLKVASLFFQDSSQTGILTSSYVDQMQSIYIRLKKTTEIINANIDGYVGLELLQLKEDARVLRKERLNWNMTAYIVLSLVLLTGGIMFIVAIKQQGMR
jgi:hypothetical protein